MTFRLTLLASILIALSVVPANAAPPAWLCSVWAAVGSTYPGCPSTSAPSFQPTFEPNPSLQSPFSGASQPLNPYYFATQATADKVCALLGCTGVYIAPQCDIGGGPVTCSVPERILKFALYGDKNAGFLAAYWDRNPDNLYPGVALSLAKADLAR